MRISLKVSDYELTLKPLGHNKNAFCTGEGYTIKSLSAKTQFASSSVPAIYLKSANFQHCINK